MKNFALCALAITFATSVAAEERDFHCTSDLDGTEIRLRKNSDENTGTVSMKDISGSATVFRGMGSLAFMHFAGDNVMTFFVNFSDMTYDLSIRGPKAGDDYGKCTEMPV